MMIGYDDIKKCVVTVMALALAGTAVHAQTIPVGLPVLEDYYRRQQLLGHVDSAISFSIRPLTAQALQQHEYLHYPDESRTDAVWQSGDGHGYLQLLPVVWRSEEHTSELQSLMRISYAV